MHDCMDVLKVWLRGPLLGGGCCVVLLDAIYCGIVTTCIVRKVQRKATCTDGMNCKQTTYENIQMWRVTAVKEQR